MLPSRTERVETKRFSAEEDAAHAEDRRAALAAALVLAAVVLCASAVLVHGMRQVALEQDCDMVGQVACTEVANR